MGIFGRRRKDGSLPVLHFKDGESFLDYHSEFMMTDVEPGVPIAALVLDAQAEFGTEEAVQMDEQGIQTVALKVASSDGGFKVLAQTASGNGVRLRPGDIVAWVPEEHLSDLGLADKNQSDAWIGFIVAKIAPEIDENTQRMKVLSRY